MTSHSSQARDTILRIHTNRQFKANHTSSAPVGRGVDTTETLNKIVDSTETAETEAVYRMPRPVEATEGLTIIDQYFYALRIGIDFRFNSFC